MPCKFNRSAICKQALFNARCAARHTGVTIRSALSAGFKAAWAVAKLNAERASSPRALAAPIVHREERATHAQVAYIARLGGICPAGTTKREASALIDGLLATKRSRAEVATRYAEEPYSAEEARRLRGIRRVYGAIVD